MTSNGGRALLFRVIVFFTFLGVAIPAHAIPGWSKYLAFGCAVMLALWALMFASEAGSA